MPPESGTIRKSWKNRLRVALAYPNVYAVGMANLGFQTVYRLFNQAEHVVCERVFVPDRDVRPNIPLASLESGRPLTDFDIVAFSVSFENDYPHLLTLLAQGGLPLRSHERNQRQPLVLAGGVACFLNPEPLAAFVDLFLLGEAEAVLPAFLEHYQPGADRRTLLQTLCREVAGAYVPAFYQAVYRPDGGLADFVPRGDVPPHGSARLRARSFAGADLQHRADRPLQLCGHLSDRSVPGLSPRVSVLQRRICLPAPSLSAPWRCCRTARCDARVRD